MANASRADTLPTLTHRVTRIDRCVDKSRPADRRPAKELYILVATLAMYDREVDSLKFNGRRLSSATPAHDVADSHFAIPIPLAPP